MSKAETALTGNVRIDSDRIDSDRMDSDRMDSDRMDSDRMDSDPVGSVLMGSVPMGHEDRGTISVDRKVAFRNEAVLDVPKVVLGVLVGVDSVARIGVNVVPA